MTGVPPMAENLVRAAFACQANEERLRLLKEARALDERLAEKSRPPVMGEWSPDAHREWLPPEPADLTSAEHAEIFKRGLRRGRLVAETSREPVGLRETVHSVALSMKNGPLKDRLFEALAAVDRVGVHQTHCCPVHGCKYGDEDCPVDRQEVAPQYPNNNGCESCEADRAGGNRFWGFNDDELNDVVTALNLTRGQNHSSNKLWNEAMDVVQHRRER